MDPVSPPSPPHEANDIFSLSDSVLSSKLRFIEEIGFGNWGSVWLCNPKNNPTSHAADDFDRVLQPQIAVKLVHRNTKSKTTVARVKSLWNEMKIIRTFKSDPHPSIIPFYSFVITPSYALITMAYLPALVPVEVDESQARGWFRFLLSGVEFLHKRGVVHNDIKPANILISHKNIPVLVDFGFAEKYDIDSETAFHSKVSYGTPEYLSPERAREIPHDCRKSDVWSLGVTFFEILTGRTPFEECDQEQFTTKEDLEKYWSRTLRGKWIGSWTMSKGMEKLLRRMISPNADLRCTASEAMQDPYWKTREEDPQHRRSSSHTSSLVFEKDMSKLLDRTPSRSHITKGKENLKSPLALFSSKSPKVIDSDGHRTVARSKSQPKVIASKIQAYAKKRVPVPPLTDLSPIKASPASSPSAKPVLHAISRNGDSKSRIPLTSRVLGNLPISAPINPHRGRVLGDVTGANVNVGNARREKGKGKEKENLVDQRVKDWEKLREISRLEDSEEELEHETRRGTTIGRPQRSREGDKENRTTTIPTPPPSRMATPSIPANTSFGSPLLFKKDSTSALNVFKHSIKSSIDKTINIYKSSTLGQAAGRRRPSCSIDLLDNSPTTEESWDASRLLTGASASTPALLVQSSTEEPGNQGAGNQDRISMWMRNVEKVVDDARQNFFTPPVVSSPGTPKPAPLRPSTQNRSNRSSRLPRRVLPANQIFADDPDHLLPSPTMTSFVTSGYDMSVQDTSSPVDQGLPLVYTPTKKRRATVSASSPEASLGQSGSPSERKEKSRSHADLLQMRIAPISAVDVGPVRRMSSPLSPSSSRSAPSPPLDRNMFIDTTALSMKSLDSEQVTTPSPISRSFDELTSSPLHVEPYPPRKPSTQNIAVPDSPNQRRLEGVYDRFLMATSSVKRLGKGYQSDNPVPVHNTVQGITRSKSSRPFASIRRTPMPPPVSSDDMRRAASVDELGFMSYATTPATPSTPALKDESRNTVTKMRRAIKAFVPGKSVSRRLTRHHA